MLEIDFSGQRNITGRCLYRTPRDTNHRTSKLQENLTRIQAYLEGLFGWMNAENRFHPLGTQRTQHGAAGNGQTHRKRYRANPQPRLQAGSALEQTAPSQFRISRNAGLVVAAFPDAVLLGGIGQAMMTQIEVLRPRGFIAQHHAAPGSLHHARHRASPRLVDLADAGPNQAGTLALTGLQIGFVLDLHPSLIC